MKEYEVDVRKLNNLSIYQLREVGAKVGVRNPTSLRSEELRKSICAVVTGKVKPYLKAKSGRPHKEIISDADWDTIVGFDNSYELGNRDDMLSLYSTSSCVYPASAEEIFTGFVMQIYGELIIAVGQAEQVRLNRYARINRDTEHYTLLRPGDIITATLSPLDKITTDPYVTAIVSINGETDFDKVERELDNAAAQALPGADQILAIQNRQLEFRYPQLKFLNNDYPVKLGQRALFVGEDKCSGQDFLANSLAKDLSKDYHIIHFSCSKMPEDKIHSYGENVEYFFSSFDITCRDLVFAFEVALERAKNLSTKMHTVMIIDDIYDIMQAYITLIESKKPIETTDIPYNEVLQQIKVLFASTGIKGQGSLTLFGFSSVPKEAKYAEFLHSLDSIANAHFVLDREAFVAGKDEYLDRTHCRVNSPKRTIA